ncbi:MAG: hypothetical protein WBB76_01360 [Gaiellaceae bacterium]
MTDQRQLPPEEQFKWYVLDLAREPPTQGTVYGFAPAFFPDATRDELYEIVRRTMLELYDHGLIMLFRASESEGFNVGLEDLDKVKALDRGEVLDVLDDPDVIDPPDQVLFFHDTRKGREVLEGLPPGAVPELGSWTNPHYKSEGHRPSWFKRWLSPRRRRQGGS